MWNGPVSFSAPEVLSFEPLGQGSREACGFFQPAQRHPPPKHRESLLLDLAQDASVDPSHRPRWQERLEILARRNSGRIAGGGATGFKCHQTLELLPWSGFEDLLLGDSKSREVFERQVNPPLAGVLPDITEDVRELQGMAKMDRVGFALGITATKNLKRNESGHGSYFPAIGFQIGNGLEAARVDIRSAPAQDFEKEISFDRVAFDQSLDLVVASLLDGEIPLIQSPLALRRRESFVIGDVIHRTAESIKKHRILAAFPWEKKKSVGQVGISRLRE